MPRARGHSVCRLCANKHDHRWNVGNGGTIGEIAPAPFDDDAMSPNPQGARDIPAGALRERLERGRVARPRIWLLVFGVEQFGMSGVARSQSHVDWGWSDSEKRDSLFCTQLEQIAGPKACGMNRVPGLVTVAEPRQTSKAKRSDLHEGLAKGARRSGMKAKVVVTQRFETRDNRAMPLS